MKVDYKLFLTTVYFYLLLFINPNSKTLVLFFIAYFFVVCKLENKFKSALFFVYLTSIPFRVGKTFVFEFISQLQLHIPYRPYGIDATFVIAVKEIFLVAMALIILREFVSGNRKAFRIDALSILLGLYSASVFVASALGSIRPGISILFSLYDIEPLIVYWYVRLLLDSREKIFSGVLAILSASIFLEFILAVFQFIQGSPLGLSIEEAGSFSRIEIDRELGGFAFRSLGTFYYANWLAHYLLPYTLLFLPNLFLKIKKHANIGVYTFIFAFMTLLLTLGRSAWVSFLLCFVLYLFLIEKIWQKKVQFTSIARKLFFLSLPGIMILVVALILPRLGASFYFFDSGGGWQTRLRLFGDALRTIQTHLLFGVGKEMDVFYSYSVWRGSIDNTFLAFPEPVHNGILRLGVQSGVFPVLFFIALSLMLLHRLKQKIHTEINFSAKIILLSVFLAVAASYMNIFAQPMMPNLSEVIFLVVIALDRYNLHSLLET